MGAVVHAEWKMNRYVRTSVDNTPKEDDEGYDVEVFPIESITKSNRPTAGIAKAQAGFFTAADKNYNEVPGRRFYVADADDEYKYWSSPEPANASTGVIAKCAPQVLYVEETNVAGAPVEKNISVNKIHFTVETSISVPSEMSVQTKTKTGSWTTVATMSNFTIPASGVVELWYNGTGWSNVKSLENKTLLSGVRLVVTKMLTVAPRTVSVPLTSGFNMVTAVNTKIYPSDIGSTISGPGIQTGTIIKNVRVIDVPVEYQPTWPKVFSIISLSKNANQTGARNLTVTPVKNAGYFNLIELGLALEQDLTADLIAWSDSFTMGEKDFITPLGTISSNEGAVTLWNGDKRYSNSNPESDLYGILDKGVKFSVGNVYSNESIQEFELYSDNWNSGDEETNVTLIDQSQMFMESKPKSVIYQKIPVQEAVWRICDQIGFTKYKIDTIDKSAQAVIDIFWTDGEKTAWEVFSELSRATQTAIYFDSYGWLRVKTRDAAWNKNTTPVFTFSGESVPGGAPANIESLDERTKYEANKVIVNWTPTAFSKPIENTVPMEAVWEPEGDVVLRSSQLVANMPTSGVEAGYIRLNPAEGKTWPYKGIVQIEGEFIEYDAKVYAYQEPTPANGDTYVKKTAWVSSLEEQEKYDDLTGPWKRHLNSYTGVLRVKERGLWNTPVKAHNLDITGWTKTRKLDYSGAKVKSPSGGIYLNKGQSTLSITCPNANYDEKDYIYLHRGSSADAPLRYLGMRMKIDKSGHKQKQAGIFFNGTGTLGGGYYVDIMATSKMTGSMRTQRNELVFYAMKPDGTKKRFGGDVITVTSGKTKVKRTIGEQLAVVAGNYIDFDIYMYGQDDTAHKIQVWANGNLVLEATVPKNDPFNLPFSGKFGVYTCGHSSATFEYVYGSSTPSTPDTYAYYNNVHKVWESNKWLRDYVYETRNVRRKVKKKWKKVQQRYGQRYFEEFGPIVNEVREFDVKFEKNTPALQTKLYSSNSQGAVLEYRGSPTGAKFIIGNASRDNVVLNGDQAGVGHKLFVYGRPATQKEPQKIEKTDEWAVRRRGIIETEYASPWVQNKAEAEALATWLTTHWSRSDSECEVKVFGNPLVEITDLVRVKFEHINANFYVTEVSNEYGEEGLTTSLTLRKAG